MSDWAKRLTQAPVKRHQRSGTSPQEMLRQKMNSPTLQVACRRTRQKVGLSPSLAPIWSKSLLLSLMRCKRIYQFPEGTDDWFSFPRKNLCRVTTTSNPLQSILQPILRPIQGILPP